MIKINLLNRRKSAIGAQKQKIFGFDLGSLGSFGGGKNLDVDSIRDINWRKSPLVKAAAALAIVYIIQGEVDGMKQQLLLEEDAKIAAIQAEVDEVNNKLAQVKGYEPLKAQLERDEQNIQTKLTIVNALLQDRDAPVKLMKQLSQIIPEEAWINSLSVRDSKVTINGGATNYSLVSDFMKSLSESTIMGGVNISQVNESEQDGVKFQIFDITADAKGI